MTEVKPYSPWDLDTVYANCPNRKEGNQIFLVCSGNPDEPILDKRFDTSLNDAKSYIDSFIWLFIFEIQKDSPESPVILHWLNTKHEHLGWWGAIFKDEWKQKAIDLIQKRDS